MKNTKICPKCNHSEIIVIPGNMGAYGVGNNVPLGFGIFSYEKVNRYLCATCGYSEEWVDREDLKRISEKYGKK